MTYEECEALVDAYANAVLLAKMVEDGGVVNGERELAAARLVCDSLGGVAGVARRAWDKGSEGGETLMGTNIYLRRKEPRMVPEYDEVHVAKLSCGYRAHFDGSSATEWRDEGDQRPRVGSMDDLRGYLASGEWELYDEYGRPTTLEEVLGHDAYEVDGEPQNTRVSLDDYYDREGYPWSRREFC